MINIDLVTELVGAAGSILILVSMLYKTNTYKGAFFLRLINAIGSVVFVVYGFMLKAPSTIILNVFATIINIYYLFRLKKDYGVGKEKNS